MALALLRHAGAIRGLDVIAAWLSGGNVAERRVVKTVGSRELGTLRHQQRAAVAHVFGDVLKIDVWQDRLLGIPIEDDEIEVLDLAAEQIRDRKGDQRQFIDRRAIRAFLRRAQDGGMHEIDVAVRFQQVAPHSFARMRLAGDKQHPKLVAHPLDVDDRSIGVDGDFVFYRGDFELNYIRAWMVDRRLYIDSFPDLGFDRRDRFTVAPHREIDWLAPGGAVNNSGLEDF